MTWHIITSPQQDRLIVALIQSLLSPEELSSHDDWEVARKLLMRVILERGLASVQSSMDGMDIDPALINPRYPGAQKTGVDDQRRAQAVPVRVLNHEGKVSESEGLARIMSELEEGLSG